MAGCRHRAFLHCLEHGRLRLRRGAIDFIGQTNLREDWPSLKFEEPLAVGGFHHHVRAQNVGRHQVGRELDPREIEIERAGERADQERLAEARDSFQQAMPADEKTREHAVDDLLVTDDYAANLLGDGMITADEFFRPLLHGFGERHRG